MTIYKKTNKSTHAYGSWKMLTSSEGSWNMLRRSNNAFRATLHPQLWPSSCLGTVTLRMVIRSRVSVSILRLSYAAISLRTLLQTNGNKDQSVSWSIRTSNLNNNMWHNDLNSQQNISMDSSCGICKVHNILLHVHKNKTPVGTASHPKRFILDSRNALWLTVKREQETNSLFVICQKNNSSVV